MPAIVFVTISGYCQYVSVVMTRIVAIIRVRMGSERLPGKPLKKVRGEPLLGYVIKRVKQATLLEDIVVATSELPENDAIEACCLDYGVHCFRGSEDDVLGRMVGALESVDADVGVEIYGDSFLADPKIIDQCIEEYQKDPSFDFVGNDITLTYSSGLLVEVIPLETLRDAATRTSDPEFREHGTRFIRMHPEIYKLKNIEAPKELNRPDIHLDVDTPEDLEVITAIIEHFAPRTDFSAQEVILFLDAHPEIKEINVHVHRRWKESIDTTAKLHRKLTDA